MKNFVQELAPMAQVKHPVKVAALAHVQLVTINPFVDGNGRTARLLMNLLLMQQGYCITIIPPILRSKYFALLRKANFGNYEDFVIFISDMVYKSHKEYLRLLER